MGKLSLITSILACNSVGELPEGKKTVAQFVFLLPDRADLAKEVPTISDQMNAYRISIVSEERQSTEDCDNVEELKKYKDGKEIQYDLKADCEYSVAISLGAYQITPTFVTEEPENGSEFEDGFGGSSSNASSGDFNSGFSLTGKKKISLTDENLPLDFIFYETSFELQRGQTTTGIVQTIINLDPTSDGQRVGLSTEELELDIPVSPGISDTKQLFKRIRQ